MGQGYLLNSGEWYDLKTIDGWNNSHICVKAYTSSASSLPVANFSGTPTSGTAPLTVTFTDTSTGSPTSWNWSFGDGNFSAVQNPVYTYVSASTYTVSLIVTNPAGSNTKTVADYITVNAAAGVDTVGVFRGGVFYRKNATDIVYGLPTDTPIIGDWNGYGISEVGVFRGGVFYRNGATDIVYGLPTDTPVIGDWNGDHISEVGVFRGGVFYRNGATDIVYGLPTDTPVIGDWNGDGISDVGVFREGVFYRNGATDIVYGLPGDVPIAGRFTTSGSGNLTFVVFGDSPDPANNTTTGISPYLSPIATAVAAEKPDLVMYTGDLVNGWMLLPNESPMATNYSGQFENWMQAVSPIHNYTTGTGIPLYVLRGNHEDGPNQTIAPLLEAYRITVASGMPKNGPPGEENLSYSFTYKGAKFIALDQYIAHNGIKETVNQSWVDEQLTQDTRPFMFVFGHSPAYLVVTGTEEDMVYSLAMHPAQRDMFWTSLLNNNVPAYFCGHSHMYVRGENSSVQQVLGGNGGAAMLAFDPALADPALTVEYPLQPIAQNDQKVGYLVITVHEDSGKFSGVQKVLNPVTNMWEVGDTFTIYAR